MADTDFAEILLRTLEIYEGDATFYHASFMNIFMNSNFYSRTVNHIHKTCNLIVSAGNLISRQELLICRISALVNVVKQFYASSIR